MFTFLDQSKLAKMQLVHDPSLRNIDNLNTVRRGASRDLRNKIKACLKAKIQELETKGKIKYRELYRESIILEVLSV